MIILKEKMTMEEIGKLSVLPNGFIKGVVDIDKELVALEADMHYQLADHLKSEVGSEELNMWGFNLWLEESGIDNILEYDSMINIHNNQLHGNLRGGMNIADSKIEEKATEVICKWIQF